MPYKVTKNGNKYCVEKEDGSSVKGGCHSSRADAVNHMQAIYANENKEINGFLSKISEFVMLIKEKLENIVPKSDTTESPISFTKEKSGRLRFIVRYSNNFRDDDIPSDIIAEKSHVRFVELVDKGIAPMPELWIWHVPEWKFGQVDWLAYDDSGFAMASGLVDEGKEHIAQWLSKQKGVRTSHGMPPETIKRDPEDPSIIVEHETVEISVLPEHAAANKLTGYYILGNEETKKEAEKMAIPENKLQKLVEQWGADPKILEELEAENANTEEKAVSAGIERKEVTDSNGEPEKEEEVAQSTPNTTETTDTTSEPVEEEVATEERSADGEEKKEVSAEDAEVADANGDNPLTRAEIAEAVIGAMTPLIRQYRELAESVDGLKKEISELKKVDEEKIEKAVSESTPASIGAMIARQLSAIGNPDAYVDGRSSLAKDKPETKETQAPQRFGIPFIDEMIANK